MFSHVKSGRVFLLSAVLCASSLGGTGNCASAESARTKTAAGVSIRNGNIVIDGIGVPRRTGYYKSTVTGDEYRISYHAGSVTVVSVKGRTSLTRKSQIKIEATASDGNNANAGRVVVVR